MKILSGENCKSKKILLKYSLVRKNIQLAGVMLLLLVFYQIAHRLWFGIQELTNQCQYSLRQKNQARLAAMLKKQCRTQEDAESILLEPNMEKEGNFD